MDNLYRVRSEYQELRSKLEQTDKSLVKVHDNLFSLHNNIKNNYTINNCSAAGNTIILYNNRIIETINLIRTKLIPSIDEEIQKINNTIVQG